MDDSRATSPTLRAHFAKVSEISGVQGPVGQIIHRLSAGELTPWQFLALCREYGLRRERWFRSQILDLIIGYVKEALQPGPLTTTHLSDVRILSMCLDVADGEFVDLRPAEIAALLGEQLDRILEDAVIDDEEELYQVDLQAAFGLGYDDYLTLVRRAFERTYGDLSARAARGEPVAEKLRAIEPIYRLTISRPRTLGALF